MQYDFKFDEFDDFLIFDDLRLTSTQSLDIFDIFK